MAVDRDRVYLILFSVYVAILVFATIGELTNCGWILDLFDVKRLFSW